MSYLVQWQDCLQRQDAFSASAAAVPREQVFYWKPNIALSIGDAEHCARQILFMQNKTI
jgi:hypothetical protein